MKKLFSLLTLLLLLCTSAWAQSTYEYYYNGSSTINTSSYFSGTSMSSGYNNSMEVEFTNASSTTIKSKKFAKLNSSGKVIFTVSANKKATVTILALTKDQTSDNGICLRKGDTNSGEIVATGSNAPSTKFTTYTETFSNLSSGQYSIWRITQENAAVYVKVVEVDAASITSETFSGVKVSGVALTEGEGPNGYSLSGEPATTITLTNDLAVGSVPDNITLTNRRTWSDSSVDYDNVAVTFGETPAEGYFTGSATIGATSYTVLVKYIAACETPTISTDPVSAVYATGDAISALTVSASVSDGGSLSYQWYKDDEAIDGATNASYTPSAAGDYKCVVTNSLAGYSNASATSEEATITITAAAGTVTLNKNNVPDKNTEFSEGVITIDGDAFPDKGNNGNNTKVRTNNNIEIIVSDGYLITSVSIYGKTARDNQSIAMNSISVDNSTISHDAFSFTDSYSTLSTGTIYAKSNVTFTFDGAVVLSGEEAALNQIYATITIKWAKIDDEFDIVAGDYVTYSSTSVIDIPSGITAYTGEYNEATSMLSLNEIEGTSIPAAAGVILHNEGGSTVHAIIPRSTAVDPEIPTNNLTGAPVAFSAFDRTNYTYYVLGEVSSVVGFYKYTGSGAIPAHKAYLRISNSTGEAGAPAVIRIVDEENNATGIDDIESTEKAVKFIENGKIYIKRDNVIYDALGRVVR